MSATYTVEWNRCDCHVETCCCDDWAILKPNGEKHSTQATRKLAEEIACALSRAAATTPEGKGKES